MSDRAALKRAYKESPPLPGVWVIRNLKTRRFLLGAAPNPGGMINRHQFCLSTDIPGAKPGLGDRLPADYAAQQGADFEFAVLDTLKPKEGQTADFDPTEDLKNLAALWKEQMTLQGWTPYP